MISRELIQIIKNYINNFFSHIYWVIKGWTLIFYFIKIHLKKMKNLNFNDIILCDFSHSHSIRCSYVVFLYIISYMYDKTTSERWKKVNISGMSERREKIKKKKREKEKRKKWRLHERDRLRFLSAFTQTQRKALFMLLFITHICSMVGVIKHYVQYSLCATRFLCCSVSSEGEIFTQLEF